MEAPLTSIDPQRTYWCVAVPAYKTTGVPTHLSYEFLAVQALPFAWQHGCEEIAVEIKYMRTQRFSTMEVIQEVRCHVGKYWGLMGGWPASLRDAVLYGKVGVTPELPVNVIALLLSQASLVALGDNEGVC